MTNLRTTLFLMAVLRSTFTLCLCMQSTNLLFA